MKLTVCAGARLHGPLARLRLKCALQNLDHHCHSKGRLHMGFSQKQRYLVAVFVLALAVGAFAAADAATVHRVPRDFATIQAAVDAADPGDTIRVGPGEFAGATITKRLTLKGSGSNTRIVSGVWFQGGAQLDTSFFIEPQAAGTIISHFVLVNGTFPHVFGVFARATDHITLSHLTILNPWQGITNNGGKYWTIIHNKIEGYPPDSSYATGIYLPAAISNLEHNLVALNTIDFSDGEGDNSDGILMVTYEDTWVGMSTGNKIVHNKIKSNETGFTIASFGISLLFLDYTGGSSSLTLFDNIVSFNDCRGNNIPIDLFCWPEDPACVQSLIDSNEIVGNLGDVPNRSGASDPDVNPSDFRPHMQ
jgi:hypothetical protein